MAATVTVSHTNPQEAIEYFRNKLPLPTTRWDQVVGDIRGKAFTVAGATQMGILHDFTAAIERAIEEGTTLSEFQGTFDQVVEEFGWSYRGSRQWRSALIFNNNVRTSYLAGRWQQYQRVKDRRPFLGYFTVGDSRVRDQHQVWDGTVLPIDDPWWDTHYPPNGFNCRCSTRSLSQRQMEREGLQETDTPPLDNTERFNPHTGEIYGEVPAGIDVSWNYNVGKAWMAPDRVFGERIMALPSQLRRAMLDQVQLRAVDADPAFEYFANQAVMTAAAGQDARGVIRTAGWLPNTVIEQMIGRGAKPGNAAILVRDRELVAMTRSLDGRTGLDADTIRRLPALLRDAEAVVWDADESVLRYYNRLDAQQLLEITVAPSLVDDATVSARPVTLRSNVVIGGRLVDRAVLEDGRYEVLQ